MGQHCGHHHDQEAQNLGLVFVLNLGFSIIELIGGILSNSVALIADAIHDAGDALAIGLAWGLAKMGNRKRSQGFSYGYRRLSLLSSLITSLILVVGAVVMFYLAIGRVAAPPLVRSELMFGFAVLGLAVNGFAFWRTQHGKTMNERVISLHLLEDVLGWAAVLVGAIVIYFTQWYIVDALLAMGISVWIFIHGGQAFLRVIRLFLQAIPSDLDLEKIKSQLCGIKGIESVHDMHCWSLDGHKNVASCHLVVRDPTDVKIKSAAREIFNQAGVTHVTLELETKDECCGLETC